SCGMVVLWWQSFVLHMNFILVLFFFFFFSSRRRHTRWPRDWSSDVCSSDLRILTAEVQEAAKILGITTQVLDIHDGELLPTLENRRTITRLIREWKADIVMSHRPNDYHPDHRYTGILVQDSAYMVTVPFFCPDTQIL